MLAGDGERLLVALTDLLGGDALLEPVVARQDQIMDFLPRLFGVNGRIMLEPGGRCPPAVAEAGG